MNTDDHLRPTYSEKIVIGSILVRGLEGLDEAKGIIQRSDFYQSIMIDIWDVANTLADTRFPIDMANVFGKMTQLGIAKELGENGPAFLLSLHNLAGIGSNLEYHARIVAEAAKRKRLLLATDEIIRDANDSVTSADDAIAIAQRKLQDIDGELANGPRLFSEVFKETVDDLNQRSIPGYKTEISSTGFEKLDFETAGGFVPGELVIIAARPGRGKTALLLHLVRHLAEREKVPLLFSLEMRAKENAARVIAAESRTDSRFFRGVKKPEDHDWERIIAAYHQLANGPESWIDDRPDISVSQITSLSRRNARRRGTKVVLVDYLQLVRPDDPKESRYLQVGRSARDLKLLARNQGIVVVCAAQLNRQIEGRTDATPRLSDLRDSGEIEQHADFVFFLHGNAQTQYQAEEKIELICGKGRSVPAGYKLDLTWNKPRMTFEQYYGI